VRKLAHRTEKITELANEFGLDEATVAERVSALLNRPARTGGGGAKKLVLSDGIEVKYVITQPEVTEIEKVIPAEVNEKGEIISPERVEKETITKPAVVYFPPFNARFRNIKGHPKASHIEVGIASGRVVAVATINKEVRQLSSGKEAPMPDVSEMDTVTAAEAMKVWLQERFISRLPVEKKQ
jgi:hypothetical protein